MMDAAQVIDNEICFKHTEYDSIVELFNSRAQMHKRVSGGWVLRCVQRCALLQ